MQARSRSHIRLNGHRQSLREAGRKRSLSFLLAALALLGLAGALLLTGCDGGPGPDEGIPLSPDVVALTISEGEVDTTEQYPNYRLIIEMTNTADIPLISVFLSIALRNGDQIVEEVTTSSTSGDPLAPNETQVVERTLGSAYHEFNCYAYSVSINYASGVGPDPVALESKSYPGTCG